MKKSLIWFFVCFIVILSTCKQNESVINSAKISTEEKFVIITDKNRFPYVKFELNPMTGKPSIQYIHFRDSCSKFDSIDTLLLIQGFEKGYEFKFIFRNKKDFLGEN